MGYEGHGDAIVRADLGPPGPGLPAVVLRHCSWRERRERKGSLAHPARVGETFDWMAREGVVVAQLRMGAVRKGAGGHAAGLGRDRTGLPRASVGEGAG